MSTAPTSFLVAADVVALTHCEGALCVLLIERGHDPYRGRLALPGGFVEPGEAAEQAARRELAEETGIAEAPERFVQLGAYGPAGRKDPRGDILTVAFIAVTDAPMAVHGGDDAAHADWYPVAEVLTPGTLAFDHAEILADALARARELRWLP